jgi:hypothetical protein
MYWDENICLSLHTTVVTIHLMRDHKVTFMRTTLYKLSSVYNVLAYQRVVTDGMRAGVGGVRTILVWGERGLGAPEVIWKFPCVRRIDHTFSM